MRGEFAGHAFISLLEEPDASRSLELLTSRLSQSALACCVKPPVAGLAFITTTGDVSEMLDSWWRHSVPPELLPVVIVRHEPGLERWVEHMDAEAVVGVASDAELGLYAGLHNVRAVAGAEGLALAEFVVRAYPGYFEAANDSPQAPAPTPAAPPGPAERLEDPPAPARSRRKLLDRATAILGPASRGRWVPEELATLAASHPLGRVVGVTSRAGGVGKTAIAAALGIVYGEALRDSGSTAAVVDQNIGNPDQWGRLSLDAEVPTVSQVMADLERGRDLAVPAWNRTPALAVYPERRDVADGYSPAQVERLAARLRRLHALSVVDLPNRIPSFASPEAALCAAWVAVADLLLVPTTDDPTRLQGVLDYLDAPMLAGDGGLGEPAARVIVPYQRSPLRELREDAGVRALLDSIRSRVVAVVEVPKDERATLAIVRGQPITEVDSRLRDAFVELALTVARALADG